MSSQKDVRYYWNENADSWFHLSEKGEDIWRDFVNTPAFLDMLPDISDKIGLDIGCGDGHNSRIIAQRCQSLIAIDIANKFLKLNKKISNPPNITYFNADGTQAPFADEYFDFVVSTMSFMDTKDINEIFTEIYRMLSPSGFFQFSITHPCFNEFKGRWVVNKNKIEGLLVKDYFKVVEGDIHEWRHPKTSLDVPPFRVPRFLKPLSTWINALIKAGFMIEEIREPHASDELVKKFPELDTTRIVAHSLIIKVKKNNEFQKSLREVTEELPGNLWWKDRNLKYLGCNNQVIKVLGFNSRREFIGKTDYDLWEESIAKKLEEADNYVLRTGETIKLEEKIVEANGRVVTMLTNKSPLHDANDNIIGVMGTSTDITELKSTQEKLKKAEGQLDGMLLLSASIAHELRTPLASIRAGVKGLKDLLPRLLDAYNKAKEHGLEVQPISKRVMDFAQDTLERVDDSAKQSHLVIDMILTSISTDEKSLRRNDFCSIKKSVNDALSEYSFQPGKASLVKIKPIDDFNFYGSETLVKHIIFNLLRNALYFIDKAGKGEVTLWTSREANFNRLHFKDTGSGIPENNLKKIFDRFFTEGTHRGTGIGLSFCKMVMESIGGKIECYSRFNEYTEFILSFPLPNNKND